MWIWFYIIMYWYADTGYIYQDKDSAGRAELKAIKELRRPFIPKAKKLRNKLHKRVEESVRKYTNDMALGNHDIFLNNFNII